MKRILHLISQVEPGGAQRQLAYLLSFSKQYEYEVASLIECPPEKRLSFYRTTSIPMHFLSNSNDFYAPEIKAKLDELLANGSFSLVHTWLYQSIVQGAASCRERGIPCIVSPRSMHDAFDPKQNKRWERFLIKRTLRITDLAICPSQSVALDFLDRGWIHPDRTRVVHNGVDTDHFRPGSNGNWIVAVGRPSSEKAFDEFEAIGAILRKTFPEIRCVVAGPPVRNSGSVEFQGFQDDVREIFQNAAIYISTSKTEGMSNALLEALSMGIPAVVRAIGSNSEIIENGVDGFLAHTVEEFVRACETLLKNPSLRKQMGENARKKAESQFSVKAQIAKIESIYSELL
jgi:glycosyltransferase involved in cell wall biosynthesis